jgi:ferric-dicitrate binding protein FerR (iron transport regulator)
MNLKENNNKKVDQAWDRLYGRLEQEGLLTDKKLVREPSFQPVVLRWAASLVLIITASLFVYKGFYSSQTEIITLTNNEESSTFVTTLEDGSVVYLAKNSSLSYPKHFKKDKREVLLKGDAFFEISKNKKRPFTIETDLINVEVLGTSFNVIGGDSSLQSLSVNTGEVKVTLIKDGQSTHITAGETVLINPDNLQTIQTSDIDQFIRYRDKMHFKDERLEDVINVINRKSDGLQLEITPELEGRLITATFSKNSPDSMAQLICIALNLKYSQQKNTIQIYE